MLWKKFIPTRSETLKRAFKVDFRKLSTSKLLRTDHYDVLGVRKDATQAEIKNAYFELSKLYHPDRIAATDENLAKFRAISDAYEILGNEQARKLYDRGLLKGSGASELSGDQEDIKDPIIKFYRERHQRGKEMRPDSLSSQYFSKGKKSVYDEQELARQAAVREMAAVDPRPATEFVVFLSAIVAFIIGAQYENTAAHRAWVSMADFFDSKK